MENRPLSVDGWSRQAAGRGGAAASVGVPVADVDCGTSVRGSPRDIAKAFGSMAILEFTAVVLLQILLGNLEIKSY